MLSADRGLAGRDIPAHLMLHCTVADPVGGGRFGGLSPAPQLNHSRVSESGVRQNHRYGTP